MSALVRDNLSDGPATILVVDSDVLVRIVIAGYLRGCAYRVLEAATASEAMAILGEVEITIDAAVIDVELRGELNGFVLAQWIRANRPAIKVVLAGTIAKAASIATDLCEEGPLMTKPYDKQAVIDRIKRLLAAAAITAAK